MKNVKVNIVNDKLNIEIDLSKNFGKSQSGKSIIIGSTNGNIVLAYKDNVKLGVNCYKPEPE